MLPLMPEAAIHRGTRQAGQPFGGRIGMGLPQPSSAHGSRSRWFAALVLLAGLFGACHAQTRVTLTVSAAASLKGALTEAEAAYRQSHANVEFVNNFASSGTLAAQIRSEERR